MTSRVAALVACLVGLAALLAPARARAVERQHKIGVGPTLDLLKVGDKSTLSVGGGVALHYTYGLSDQFKIGRAHV